MDSNTEFAAMNFQNFSLQQKKTNNIIFLGAIIIIVSGIAIYYFLENNKNKSTITVLSNQMISLKNQVDLEKEEKQGRES